MNKTELIDAVAARFDHSKKDVAEIIEAVIDETKKAVHQGEKVAISGFGVFERRERAARTGRNPRTGEVVKIRATKVPAFRAGAEFKAMVAGARKAVSRATSVKAARQGRDAQGCPGQGRQGRPGQGREGRAREGGSGEGGEGGPGQDHQGRQGHSRQGHQGGSGQSAPRRPPRPPRPLPPRPPRRLRPSRPREGHQDRPPPRRRRQPPPSGLPSAEAQRPVSPVSRAALRTC